MKAKRLATYTVDGLEYQFDTRTFNEIFRRAARIQSRMSLSSFEQQVGDAVSVSSSTVHAWRLGNNAPADIERVCELANYFGLSKDTLLKQSGRERPMKGKYTDRQLEALRRIYAAVIDFLDEFQRTMGFTIYWFDIVDSGVAPEHTENQLCELVDRKHLDVVKEIKKEAFDLRGAEIYDALLDYAWEDLINIFDGKLSYGYRFEQGTELGPDTTEEELFEGSTEGDYQKALKALHAILDEYL